MKTNVKKSTKKVLTLVIVLALMLTTLMIPGSVAAYGPTTMYTPLSSDPSSGCLYGRAMQSSDGKMYATFEQCKNTQQVFPIYESTNNGQTWSQVGSVQDTQHGWGMRWEPQLYQLPQAIGGMAAGTFLCAGVSSDKTSFSIDLYKSTDSGRNWTFVSTIATGSSSTPIWEPFLLVANNKLICYYSDCRDSAHSQKLVHQTTTNGTSWGSVFNDVALSDGGQRPGMVCIAQMPNGSYIMTYEIYGMGGAWYQTSSNPESWNVTSTGTCFDSGGSSPYCINLNGTIILSSAGNGNLYANCYNAQGTWTQIGSTLGAHYSRCLVPMQNGRVFEIGAGWPSETVHNVVSYADMPVYYKFVNSADGNAIDSYGRTSNGSNVTQYPSGSSYNQQWQIIGKSSGYYGIYNRSNGLYLDSLGHTGNGCICGMWSSSSSNNQKWTIQRSNGYVKLVNLANGLCLDTGGVTTSGADLQMWSSGGSTNQQWTQVPQY